MCSCRYAAWHDAHSDTSTLLVASYESALVALGAPASMRQLAVPNEVLTLALPHWGGGGGGGGGVGVGGGGGGGGVGGGGGGGGGRGVEFAVMAREPFFTWDLRQHKTSTDDWVSAFRRAVARRTRGLKHRAFIGLSAGCARARSPNSQRPAACTVLT
jgi:hypothetical protein